jgi:hypothetical protein
MGYLPPVPRHQSHRVSAHIAGAEGRSTSLLPATGNHSVTWFAANASPSRVRHGHFAAHGELEAISVSCSTASPANAGLPGSSTATPRTPRLDRVRVTDERQLIRG